ncbi:rifin [Plasmodium reichenowi]|uniref:Rifin n=1 Tax=Plasmodium reichenowi TaxID=5854 RepID=A0A060RM74_PLARE|nr:rifin [Plasmodium reichenowi]
MKVHYINILLFALPLNILVYNQRNHNSTTPHTPKIPITRLLCECELYVPANYDNDPQMKDVMETFNKQTQQRFHEYDERMIEKRKHCKDKCDKEIQKIILKDKLEKQMAQHFATLDTDIQNDAIPTCVCEKSVAEKVEKGCLRCGGILGSAVPELGAMGATALYALNQLKPYALFSATKYALAKGVSKGAIAGKAAGMRVVIVQLKKWGIEEYCNGIYKSMIKIKNYTDLKDFAGAIIAKHDGMCAMGSTEIATCKAFGVKLGTRLSIDDPYGSPANYLVPRLLEGLAKKAKGTADFEAAEVSFATSSKIINEKTALIEGGFNSSTASIYVSIIAIVVIVLVMVIIYLILRYRRKTKMKKKLQYIKLLEE